MRQDSSTAYTETIQANVTDGELTIELLHTGKDNPKISGIEIHKLSGTDAPATTEPSSAPTVAPTSEVIVTGDLTSVYINAGSNEDYNDGEGIVWKSDSGYYDVGDSYTVPNTISGTDESGLYQSERWSSAGMTYTFDVPNGEYEVVLHFAEIYANSAGFRNFDVAVQGEGVIDDLDIYATVGKFVAFAENVTALVTNGELAIDFVPRIESPKINAIEIHKMQGTTPTGVPATLEPSSTPTGAPVTPEPSSTPTFAPTSEIIVTGDLTSLYINAGSNDDYNDGEGIVWKSDSGYYDVGDSYTVPNTISGTDESGLYQSERWSSAGMTYTFRCT